MFWRRFRRLLRIAKNRLYRNTTPSVDDLDRKLAAYLDYPNGFFIEAGANDGYTQSNTYFLEKKLGWRGILVEAIPELYRLCAGLRRNSRVYNCALVASNYAQPTAQMHYADLMSVVDGSLKTQEAQQRHLCNAVTVQPSLDQSYTVEVPARTLESVLDEIDDLPEIDFFSLDVEGYELQVLKGLNLNKYRPKYLLVEAWFFPEINAYLSDQYTLIQQLSTLDYLYKRK